MAGEWTATKWGDVATLAYGKALSGYSDTKGNARVYGTNGPIGWHSEARWDGPGVIVGRKGAYRGVHYTADPYWVIDTAYSLRPKVDLNLRWAYYQLKHLDVNNIDDGSPIPSTTRDAFYVQDLLLPPREDQDRIASLLSCLDDKIELNRRMAATLEEMARALFKSWFVDFDPVRAKAEGRDPGLPAATAALFPDTFGEDGLPMGWSSARLGNFIELAYGKALKAEVRRDGRVPVYGSNGQVGLHDQALLDGPGIVVGRKGNPGTVTYVHTPFYPIDTTFYVVPRQAAGLPYLFYLMKGAGLEDRSGDSAVPGLNRDAAYSVEVVAPPSALCTSFSATCEDLLKRQWAYEAETATLRDLRNTLLPKLISGELRIKDANGAVKVA